MEIFIKNMECYSCTVLVRLEIEKIGHTCRTIELGKVDTNEPLTGMQLSALNTALSIYGLELISSKKNILTEKIKQAITNRFTETNVFPKINFSVYLSSLLNLDYTYLANTFSENQGTTIEQYIIDQKIKNIKLLIGKNDLNMTEIALLLNYSSLAHMSAQFKKVTGFTASAYKKVLNNHSLDEDLLVSDR